jgi:hypothetical protein
MVSSHIRLSPGYAKHALAAVRLQSGETGISCAAREFITLLEGAAIAAHAAWWIVSDPALLGFTSLGAYRFDGNLPGCREYLFAFFHRPP